MSVDLQPVLARLGVVTLHPGKLFVEGTALDSQNPGRLGLVAFRLLQNSLDMLALDSVKTGGLIFCLAGFEFPPNCFLRDGSRRLHRHQAADHVLQLTDIPGPLVLSQRIAGTTN